MSKMTRVKVTALNEVSTIEDDVPAPAPGQVLVRTRFAGICGSDTHAVSGHHPLLPPPYTPGHEATGTIVQLGEGVTGLEVGQRIVLKPNVTCGECVNCQAGRTNACQTLQWIGCDPSDTWLGAMADYFVLPAQNAFPVEDNIDDYQAALVECLGTPVHAVRIAGGAKGKKVVVLGAGTIGMLCVFACLQEGAERVIVTDLDASKRIRAVEFGANAAIDAASEAFVQDVEQALDGKADLVLDCVANVHSGRQAMSIMRGAATLCIVGVPASDYALPMPYVQDWEIRVQGCANYTEQDIDKAIELAPNLDAKALLGQEFPFSQAEQAFATAASSTSGKVLVYPNDI